MSVEEIALKGELLKTLPGFCIGEFFNCKRNNQIMLYKVLVVISETSHHITWRKRMQA